MTKPSKEVLAELAKKWLEKHDPVLIYKKSPRYKNCLKIKLARNKASKQAKAQKRSFR